VLALKDFLPDEEINSYKKKAIEIGIQYAVGELIVTTDADCYVPPTWLHAMAFFYETHHPQLMVMPVCMFPPVKGQPLGETMLSIFQSLDFITLQGITGASVYKKMHSMCNGANLAYTRKAFMAVNGFEGINAIASGDDMLLMHKIALAYPNGISFIKSPQLIVKTQPMKTVKEFFHQRIRWASKADKYEDKRIFWVLLLVYTFNAVFIFLPLLAIIQGLFGMNLLHASNIFSFWWLLLASKTVVEVWFLYPVAQFFGLGKLLLFFPLAQPFHIIYTIIAGWMGKFGTYQWKGRQVK
jgi:cellulose synthase/poly-beta-1,6-N-acetylglucosamine synthase-like glycosyltransferase